MTHRETAVGRKRHIFAEPNITSFVPNAVGVPDRSVVRAPDRRAADLCGGGEIPFHQGGGNREHIGVIVEPKASHVAGEKRRSINLEREQILDRVDILQTIEPTRSNAAGIGSGTGRAVERRFEAAGKRVDGGRIRTGSAFGRHLPAPKFSNHPLQDGGVCADF